MKNKYIIILLFTMILMPFKVFAAGGFGVSTTSISMYPGESKTITISTNNAVGKLNILSSNGGVVSASSSSIFIQNPGSSGSITITGNSVGTATISVVASSDFATMDEEILAGQTKTITVNVISKPITQPSNSTPSNPTPSNPQPQQPQNNLSKNNNIKSLSVDGYELVKIDNNNYTLSVGNDVTSINVNATAEDGKAKVSGTGTHEINVGENNIEVVITSESGSQNKINIKVSRKDGYYLEDLESILKNDKVTDVNIIINADSKISKEEISKIKNSKKVIKLNYFDESKKLIYSWTINGKEIKDVSEFVTTITNSSEYSKEIYKLSNYADGIYVNFKHSGELPTGTKIKLYVGDRFENDSLVNVYHYNNKKLDFVKGSLKVVEGYIEFDIQHCSEYFLTMSNIGMIEKQESSMNVSTILAIIELIVIILLVVFLIIKLRINKNNTSNSDFNNILNTINNDNIPKTLNTNFYNSNNDANNTINTNYYNSNDERN